ncbi:MAG: signal peptidase II [Ruminococcus sp.]|uniref:signal peptidase II n=1 Tax=Ruminococcus sp. TaxID=41978 RepID=UPI002873E0A0|nr:signal peptidase II [Ruminococcus sp.]MBQ3284981.1 signal peptidase II [Ruminococcus sp.]
MLIIYIAIIVILPILAQCIRTVIETNVKPEGFVSVIPGVFSLTYSENRGVAFGLFQDGTVVFAITTSIVIIIFAILLFKNYKKSKLFATAAALIIGGGLGNLFERIVLGYVVDYLSLSFFPPICNFADYCITAGTICLIVYLLFFSDFMKKDKKKIEQNDEA